MRGFDPHQGYHFSKSMEGSAGLVPQLVSKTRPPSGWGFDSSAFRHGWDGVWFAKHPAKV